MSQEKQARQPKLIIYRSQDPKQYTVNLDESIEYISQQDAIKLQDAQFNLQTTRAVFVAVTLDNKLAKKAFEMLTSVNVQRFYFVDDDHYEAHQLCTLHYEGQKAQEIACSSDYLTDTIIYFRKVNVSRLKLSNITINNQLINVLADNCKNVSITIKKSCTVEVDADLELLVHSSSSMYCESVELQQRIAHSVLEHMDDSTNVKLDIFDLKFDQSKISSYSTQKKVCLKISIKDERQFDLVAPLLISFLQNNDASDEVKIKYTITKNSLIESQIKKFTDSYFPQQVEITIEPQRTNSSTYAQYEKIDLSNQMQRNRCLDFKQQSLRINTQHYTFSLSDENFLGSLTHNCEQITDLEIKNLRCDIKAYEQFFGVIQYCKKLKRIAVVQSQLDIYQLKKIVSLIQLLGVEQLVINSCQITSDNVDVFLENLADCTSLQSLELKGTSLTQEQLMLIGKTATKAGLTECRLIGCRLTGEMLPGFLEHLQQSQVATLHFESNNFADLPDIATELSRCPSLRSLTLSDCSLSDNNLNDVLQIVVKAGLADLTIPNNEAFSYLVLLGALVKEVRPTNTAIDVGDAWYYDDDKKQVVHCKRDSYSSWKSRVFLKNDFERLNARNIMIAQLAANPSQHVEEIVFDSAYLTDAHFDHVAQLISQLSSVGKVAISQSTITDDAISLFDNLLTTVPCQRLVLRHNAQLNSERLLARLKNLNMFVTSNQSQYVTQVEGDETLALLNQRGESFAKLRGQIGQGGELDLSALAIDSADLAIVTEIIRQHADQLTCVNLASNAINSVFMKKIIPVLSNCNKLVEIDLARNSIDGTCANKLVAFLVKRKVERCNLEGSEQGLFSALFHAIKNVVADCVTTFPGWDQINDVINRRKVLLQLTQQAPPMQQSELDLSGIMVFDQDDVALVKSIAEHYHDVVTVNLAGNNLSDDCLPSLLAKLTVALPGLKSVDLSNNKLSDGSRKVLAEYLIKCGLDRIDLSNQEPGADRLNFSLLFKAIEQYDQLIATKVTTGIAHKQQSFDQHYATTTRLLQYDGSDNLSVTKLDLSGLDLSSQAFQTVLLSIIKNKTNMRELTLANTNLSDEALCQLIALLKNHPNIRRVDLSHLSITSQAGKLLQAYLVNTKILHRLVLNDCVIESLAMQHILSGLSKNGSVYDLHLDNVDSLLSSNEMLEKKLVSILRQNNTITCLSLVDQHFPVEFVPDLQKKYNFDRYDRCTHKNYKGTWGQYKKLNEQANPTLKKVKSVVSSLCKKKNKMEYPNKSLSELTLLVPDSPVHCQSSKLRDFVSSNVETHHSIMAMFCANEVNIKQLKKKLTKTISPYHRFAGGDTLFHIAARRQHVELLKLLKDLYPDFDIDLFNDKGESPKVLADQSGNQLLINALISHFAIPQPNVQAVMPSAPAQIVDDPGADVQPVVKKANVQTDSSIEEQPVIDKAVVPMQQLDFHVSQAIFSGNVEGLKYCLQQYSAQQVINGKTLFELAIEARNLNIVRLLHEDASCVLPIDYRGPTGRTALQALMWTQNVGVESDIFLQLAYYLLSNRASIVIDGHELLLTAVSKGHRKLCKLLLRGGADINKRENNHSAFTIAINRSDESILQLLLTMPNIERTVLEHALKFSQAKFGVEQQPIKKMKNIFIQMLEARVSLIPEESEHMLCDGQNIQWCRSMNVVFGASNPQRAVVVPYHEIHQRLFFQNSFNQNLLQRSSQEETESEKCGGNPVTACISFILTPPKTFLGESQKRIVIPIFLDFPSDLQYHLTQPCADKVNTVQDLRAIMARRVQSGEQLLFQQGNLSYYSADHISNEDAIPDETFGYRFHHGEQSLLTALESDEMLKYLRNKLLSLTHHIPGAKIVGAVLDIHSPRYVCDNCQVAILGAQNAKDSLFLRKLSDVMLEGGFKLPALSPIKMITRVSSHMAFPDQSKKKTIDAHLALFLDMRSLGNRIILQKDMLQSDDKITQFNSRK